MAKFLFTSDIHLTARPRDDYRWEIFPWLMRQAQNRAADGVFILGDVTDKKDHHPARLVNRFVEAVVDLAKVVPVRILTGNHDYIDPKEPYFKWISHLDCDLEWYTEPGVTELGGAQVLMLPHVREWGATGPGVKFIGHDFICCHQTFDGSVASNGSTMEGISPQFFRPEKVGAGCVTIAGDIHVPQRVGPVYYCGSPHPVHLGDSFKPRVLFHDGSTLKSIGRTTIKKPSFNIQSLDDLDALEIGPGDQISVTVTLPRSELVTWEEYRSAVKSWAEKHEAILCNVKLKVEGFEEDRSKRKDVPKSQDAEQVFVAFCKQQGIDQEFVEVGRGLVDV